MRLFVTDNFEERLYLSQAAHTRRELAKLIGGNTFMLHGQRYSIYDVQAEAEDPNTIAGALFGAFVGMLGGFIGVLIGVVIGTLLTHVSLSDEYSETIGFNVSSL